MGQCALVAEQGRLLPGAWGCTAKRVCVNETGVLAHSPPFFGPPAVLPTFDDTAHAMLAFDQGGRLIATCRRSWRLTLRLS